MMDEQIENIINYSEGLLKGNELRQFEEKLRSDKEFRRVYLTFKRVNEHLMGMFDLQEVRNDPALSSIDELAKKLADSFLRNPSEYLDDTDFITNSIAESDSIREIDEEGDFKITVINEKNHENIAEEWVKEWKEKSTKSEYNEEEILKIKSFIADSLQVNSSGMMDENKKIDVRFTRKAYIRAGALAAAILVAGILLLKIFIPAGNPEKLFLAYYQPMPAISTVTRSSDASPEAMFTEAVDLYKSEKYDLSAEKFSRIFADNPGFITARFYEGVSLMGMGQYAGAIEVLTEVVSTPGEYQQDAHWYLALSYLKTGDKELARPSLDELYKSEGYYHERAGKILRRLK